MSVAANIVVGLIGLLHVYILVLEMFLWDKPAGLRTFGQTPAQAAATKVLAANQGLYNGFLAAGLFYAIATNSREFALFFLTCVVVAALYGAYSVNKRIFLVQGVPAIAALAALFL